MSHEVLVLHLGLVGRDLGLDTLQSSVQALELLLHNISHIFELVDYLPLPLRLRGISVESILHRLLPVIRLGH